MLLFYSHTIYRELVSDVADCFFGLATTGR